MLRLQAFRAAHPEMIIDDGGFGVWQARIPEPDNERIISRYTLREVLDKLDDLTGEYRTQERRGITGSIASRQPLRRVTRLVCRTR